MPPAKALSTPKHAGRIAVIAPGSLADEAGLRPGDHILEVNGRAVQDPLDYRFQTTENQVELTVLREGETSFVEFSKEPDESLGIEFEADAFDRTRLCNNKCFFCFLKGLPKGLRKTLYVKDDDYRLSFLHGNFVTLTDLSETDWERLAEQRLSPLHVSVHATDIALRRALLGNAHAPDIVEQLGRLAAIGIDAHTQIVLCPGVNDGPALDRSLGDLLACSNVRTIAVVPVGASRDGEERIRDQGMDACTPATARAVLRQIRTWQRRARAAREEAIVHAADEFYLTAGARLPSTPTYDGFPQWENGIGMTRTLLDDWTAAKQRLRRRRERPAILRHITIGCGTLIAPTLSRITAQAAALLGVRIDVVPIHASLFGARVNVSGLLSGGDFIDQLGPRSGRTLGERVLLPRASLDYFGQRFLDDVQPEAVRTALDRPLAFAYTFGEIIEWLTAPDGGAPPERPTVSLAGRSWSMAGEESADVRHHWIRGASGSRPNPA